MVTDVEALSPFELSLPGLFIEFQKSSAIP
jgi:hypothetical protein